MSKRKLLIIEDDEDIRTQMKWALAADYEVVVAGDQTSAHAAFAAQLIAVSPHYAASAEALARLIDADQHAAQVAIAIGILIVRNGLTHDEASDHLLALGARAVLVADDATTGGWVSAQSYASLEADGFTGFGNGVRVFALGPPRNAEKLKEASAVN